MRILGRLLNDHSRLWPLWLGLVGLSAGLPVAGLLLPLVQKRLIDEVLLPGRFDGLFPTVGLYAVVWLAAMVAQVAGNFLRTYTGERVAVELRRKLFEHCEWLAVAFARQKHSGRTMALFTSDVPNVADLYSLVLVTGIGSIVTVALAAYILFSLSPELAVAAGLAPPAVGLAALLVTRPLRPAYRRVQEKVAEVTERLHEALAGLREVVAFGQQEPQAARFNRSLQELLRLRLGVALISSGLSAGQSVFSLAVTLLILGYGGYLVIEGRTTLGTLVAAQSLFSLVFTPASQLVSLFSGAQRALASAERVYAFLDQKPRVVEAPDAFRPAGLARGEIRFENVSFEYEGGRAALEDISFTVRPGGLVALVGPSGAGKTTLISLILRFYDPTSGRILLDGVDLRRLPLGWLRRQVGIVFQDTFLFTGTVRENIAFGSEDVGEADVIAAAQAANAWEFIERLPRGLDTPVGPRGAQLSEGERQRIAIARAFLRNPPILVLDEPTSSLDSRSDYLIRSALVNLTRGRTTLVIAHRLATVRQADRILVLDRGRLVEAGTHAELMARRGLYYELHRLQSDLPVNGRTARTPSGSAPQLTSRGFGDS
jgi:ABC-type multidrug transport system fused ATPase/permease subunit